MALEDNWTAHFRALVDSIAATSTDRAAFKQIAERTGMNPETFYQVYYQKSGKTHLGRASAKAIGLAYAKGRDPDWINQPFRGVAHSVSDLEPDDVVIPEFDTGGKMGDGLVLRDQPGLIKGWRVTQEWVHKNVRNLSSVANMCIVTGFGDSMRPMFNPGDPLLVDRGINTVEYDAIYFFRVEGEGFIKRLQRVPGQGLIAISENKAYRDWTITEAMDIEVFGRVMKVWRGEEF